MCRCKEPTINGQPGEYARYLFPPTPQDGDRVILDLPGRCGGIDSHSYHFMLVRNTFGSFALLYRHGGGEGRIRVSNGSPIADSLGTLTTNDAYWILHAIYWAHNDAEREAQEKTNALWRRAAADKRIKTRKMPKSSSVKVWIEEGVK